jgi:hypothetical protein
MAKEVGDLRCVGRQKYSIVLTLKCYICIAQDGRELSGLEIKKCWKQNLY